MDSEQDLASRKAEKQIKKVTATSLNFFGICQFWSLWAANDFSYWERKKQYVNAAIIIFTKNLMVFA